MSTTETPKIFISSETFSLENITYGKWINAALEIEEIKEQIKKLGARANLNKKENYYIDNYSGFYHLRKKLEGNEKTIGHTIKKEKHNLVTKELLETINQIAKFIVKYQKVGADLLLMNGHDLKKTENIFERNLLGIYEKEQEYGKKYLKKKGINYKIDYPYQDHFDYKRLIEKLKQLKEIVVMTENNKIYIFKGENYKE